jgi:chorismate--pyruvate lyase
LNIRSQLFIHPPRWQRAHHGSLPRSSIDPASASWLFEPGSLTQRLLRLVGDKFHVVLLQQSWQKPGMDEARQLGLKPGHRAIVREVALQNGPQPLVVARSIIPAQTLHGADRRLANLGSRPLGHILFADPRLQRLQLQLTRVTPGDWQPKPFPDQAPDQTPTALVWGRRSLYSLGPEHKLLVAEFFLPPLFQISDP